MSMSPLTASFPTLPLDVVELVAENLSLDKELAALKSCSLACHAFLDICRKHMFCTLRLDNSTVHRIGALQRRSRGSPAREPPLAVTNYVRNLVYITEEPTDRKHRGGPSILKYFSRVRSFTLVVNDCYSSTTQKGLPSSLKTSLSHFTRANHLVHLRLFGIKNLPATFFLQLPYLSKLSMEHSTVAEVPYVRKAEVKPLKLVSFSSHNGRIMPLLNARTANGTSILDLTGLEEFAMGVDDIATNDGMDLVKGFLETSTQLKSLTLSGLYPKLVPGLGKLAGVLTADNLKTLRILKFYPMLETCDIDPYLYLVHELEIISAKNVLQELILEIDVETDCCCTTDHDAWSKLDRVLSQKGAFPFMRRVRILITLTEYSFDYRDFIEELQEVGRVCFPWLWQSKDVEFTFKVQTEEI